MPRLRAKADPYERYAGLVLARMRSYGYSQQDMADKMGVCRATYGSWMQRPGSMTLDTMRMINRVLGIRAEDARQALPMW